jgi:Flp pilus assembly protein TadD
MRTAVRRFPNDLSLALERIGQGESAEAAMREALSLAPEDPDILYGLGSHYLKHGNLEQAQTLATRLIELYPQRPEGRHNRLSRSVQRERSTDTD